MSPVTIGSSRRLHAFARVPSGPLGPRGIGLPKDESEGTARSARSPGFAATRAGARAGAFAAAAGADAGAGVVEPAASPVGSGVVVGAAQAAATRARTAKEQADRRRMGAIAFERNCIGGRAPGRCRSAR